MHSIVIGFMIAFAYVTGAYDQKTAGPFTIMTFDNGQHWYEKTNGDLVEASTTTVLYVKSIDSLHKITIGGQLTADEKSMIDQVFPGRRD